MCFRHNSACVSDSKSCYMGTKLHEDMIWKKEPQTTLHGMFIYLAELCAQTN